MIDKAWKKTLEQLGTDTQELQMADCYKRLTDADEWCDELELTSERGFCLMFDIKVQNGKLFKVDQKAGVDVKASIIERFKDIKPGDEETKLVVVAEERSNAAMQKWRAAVLARKMAIARGEGTVHGQHLSMDEFGITMSTYYLG